MKQLRIYSISILIIVSIQSFLMAGVFIDAHLQNAMLNKTGALEVIVTFQGDGAPTPAQLDVLTQTGITHGVYFQSLPIAGVLATPNQISLLAGNSEVRSLYLNRELEYHNFNGTSITGVRRARTEQKFTQLNNGLPVSGKGITVLVNDSGIDGTHQDLEYGTHVIQNVQGVTNLHAVDNMLPVSYAENQPNTDLASGHGTHVAGTVAGTGAASNGRYTGVAPGANLVGYGSGAVVLILDALGGFDYALTHQFQYNIRVITNSWGTSKDLNEIAFQPDNPVNVASKKAYDRGIVVTFSSSNAGPGEDTHNPYAISPWVISVAAGNADGVLADFSSRGVKDQSGTFEVDGEQWSWENHPTVTGPGVDVISCRSKTDPGSDLDVAIEPAYIASYTIKSGTSMSTPHVAGIVALMLEANPALSPDQVKQILRETATNMPGYEEWEAGAGYVNAYAAVARAFELNNYGTTLNIARDFNSEADIDINRIPFNVDFYPVSSLSPDENFFQFEVAPGTSHLSVTIQASGVEGETGNSVYLALVAPDGSEYGCFCMPVAFPVYQLRSEEVFSPMSGTWKAEIRPFDEAAIPELIQGKVKLTSISGYNGLNDISGHPAEQAIQIGVAERLFDGTSGGVFQPDELLTRRDLADYLTMGMGVRQYLSLDGTPVFGDVADADRPFVEAVTARGAALRDREQVFDGVVLPENENTFNPQGTVNRAELAYSMVQSLGLQEEAEASNGSAITVNYSGEEIAIEDAGDIPASLRGYVQVALELQIMHANYWLEQDPFSPVPEIHAKFNPLQEVTRGEFAVSMVRTFDHYFDLVAPDGESNQERIFNNSNSKELGGVAITDFELLQNYPNPFNPETTIQYSLPAAQHVKIEVFNMLGQNVKTLVDRFQSAGTYSARFHAETLPSGMYIYRLTAGKYSAVKKMMLMK